MRESYQAGDQVLVFDVPYNRARAESGEAGIPARPAVVEQDVTPRPQVWNPWYFDAQTGYHGRHEEGPPTGPAMYRVVYADGSTDHVDVHRLMPPAEVAAAIHRRAAASESAAQAASAEAARHQAEAERLHAAAKRIESK